MTDLYYDDDADLGLLAAKLSITGQTLQVIIARIAVGVVKTFVTSWRLRKSSWR